MSDIEIPPTPPFESAQTLKVWLTQRVKSKIAWWWLGGYSFLEALILPFPVDPFLAIMVFFNRAKALWLTVITTLTSVFGGMVLYFSAMFLYEVLLSPFLKFLNIEYDLTVAQARINELGFWATFLGAISPIPYTPVALAAGLLGVNFFSFLLASLLGRGIRYGIVSVATLVWGVAVIDKIGRYATVATIILILAIILFVGFTY